MKILFEDDFIIAAIKPAKQFVHPMPGVPESKDCLLFDLRNEVNIKLYPINRLDRPVSGIVLFAKAPEVVTEFQNIWHDESTQKFYLCLHKGILDKAGVFNSPLSKRGAFKFVDKEIKQEAITEYNPIQIFEKYFCTFTEVKILTGRYHQIRRHFRKAVMPIIGDRKHGKGEINRLFESEFSLNQIFLHCHKLNFIHPLTDETISIASPLPSNLQNIIELLNANRS